MLTILPMVTTMWAMMMVMMMVMMMITTDPDTKLMLTNDNQARYMSLAALAALV